MSPYLQLVSVFFFFFLFLFGIPDSDEGDFQYYCARKCWKVIRAFHNTLTKRITRKHSYVKAVFLSYCIVNLIT